MRITLTLSLLLLASAAGAQTMEVQTTIPPQATQDGTRVVETPVPLDAQLARLRGGQPPMAAEGDYVPPAEQLLQTANGIPFATGGVGEEERAQIQALEPQFNLKLLTTAANGEYVSDYSVRITNASGQVVLQAPASGPYFYAKLPAGSYNVETADAATAQKPQKVTVGNGLKTLRFRW